MVHETFLRTEQFHHDFWYEPEIFWFKKIDSFIDGFKIIQFPIYHVFLLYKNALEFFCSIICLDLTQAYQDFGATVLQAWLLLNAIVWFPLVLLSRTFATFFMNYEWDEASFEDKPSLLSGNYNERSRKQQVINQQNHRIAYNEFVELTEKMLQDFKELVPLQVMILESSEMAGAFQRKHLLHQKNIPAEFREPIQDHEKIRGWIESLANYPSYAHITYQSHLDDIVAIKEDLTKHHFHVMRVAAELLPNLMRHEEERLKAGDEFLQLHGQSLKI